MPAPNKASVYPEMLAARAAGRSSPVNATTQDVLARLQQAGIEIDRSLRVSTPKPKDSP